MSIIDQKKLYIFDMDGTIYLGNKVFPYAITLINKLREKGKKVLFFTNNASRSRQTYVDRLNSMGFDAAYDEILTAGDVTINYLKKHRDGKSVYLIGTQDLKNEFINHGITLSENADIVVSSFDTELTYDKLKIGCQLIMNGAEYMCTHMDFNCPTDNGFIPDSGSISALIVASTRKRPICFGKPYENTVDVICETTNITREDMVVFGDRLYTDIAFGKNNGITSVLVLTGETKIEDLVNCTPDQQPDYTFKSLENIIDLI